MLAEDHFSSELEATASEPLPLSQLPATIRIMSSGGGIYDVAVDPVHCAPNGLKGYTVNQVLEMAGVSVRPNNQYWVGETQCSTDFVIQPGQTLTVIGSVKGG